MVSEEVIKTVEKLNANLPDDSEFAFSLETNEYWTSINFCFMSASILMWDSENDERDWIGDEKEALYPFVLDIFQNRVIQLMKIGGLTEILKATLSHTYTDLTMLEEGSCTMSSVNSSIGALQELEYIFQFDLNDTRENE